MSGSVHVEVECARDAAGLIEFLAAQGLTATVTQQNGRCALEVAYALDPAERLHGDVAHALRGWLAVGEASVVLSEAGADGYVLRPPGE